MAKTLLPITLPIPSAESTAHLNACRLTENQVYSPIWSSGDVFRLKL